MGGPMTYPRFVARNRLTALGYMRRDGDPADPPDAQTGQISGEHIAGELRRMEQDEFKPERIAQYVRVTGAAQGDVERVLRMFFGVPEPGCEACHAMGRCGPHLWGAA